MSTSSNAMPKPPKAVLPPAQAAPEVEPKKLPPTDTELHVAFKASATLVIEHLDRVNEQIRRLGLGKKNRGTETQIAALKNECEKRISKMAIGLSEITNTPKLATKTTKPAQQNLIPDA